MIIESLQNALSMTHLEMNEIDGMVAVPSLSNPHFMEAHYIATKCNLLPKKKFNCTTLDVGGASPVSGIINAKRLIEQNNSHLVAVVGGDSVSSLSTEEFLLRADTTCQNPSKSLPSPVIPLQYNRVAEWHMKKYGLERKHLAMAALLM